MMLKRFYKKPEGWVREVNDEGVCTNPPPLDYVSLGHTGVKPEQNFSAQMVATGILERWITVKDDKLILDVVPEKLVYTIKRVPGRYCLHCNELIAGDDRGIMARAHIAANHPKAKSPDPAWPAGYAVVNAFECVLDAKQHKKFMGKGMGTMSFPRKEL